MRFKKCVAHRWDAINEETEAKEQAKFSDEKYISQILEGNSNN
jgi:hypothetical protein